MTELDIEMCAVLGAAAVAFLIVAGMRAHFMRGYASLLDENAPKEIEVGRITGSYSGRGAEIALESADHTMHRPANLRLSLECASALDVEAVRESMATGLRKAFGVQPDRRTGAEELDRLFAFQFYDRSEMETLVGRPEARESFVTLAELGAGSVRLRDGLLAVRVPMRFVIPLGVERVRQILAAMMTLGSVLESSVPSLPARVAGESLRAPGRARGGVAISGPLFLGVFFVMMIVAFLVLGGFWDINGRMHWRTRLDLVTARLPLIAALTGITGFVAALIAPRKPIVWGLSLSWPLLLHAALVWIVYVIARVSNLPGLGEELTKNEEFVRRVLTTANTAPAVAFVCGLLGAALGRRAVRG